ncbi:MAG TPA: KEOPS complex N(6)-L-threonylcarbamoyladenine synthase Kae1 [archaeon]|nr:KEOPS complex N(6)-L-threonylcarbamoyladenine synthase Kae1 [archaeon]
MSKIGIGIESTAHTFGVGIVNDKGEVLANERSVYSPPLGKGIIPRTAAEHHAINSVEVLASALSKANLKMKDVDFVSVALGAGLPPCLNVGASLARLLSLTNKIPLVPVCHQIAHIEIGKLTTGSKDPVVLYLSGGNTQVIAFAEGRYRVFGETMNIPVGNAFDVLAREMKLPMPGGLEIEKLAKTGKYIEMPYTIKGMDLSFTGIATEAIKKFRQGVKREDVCYSFQETCFSMLTEVTERAMAHTDKKEILLVGGVAANKRMQEMIKIMTEERGATYKIVPFEYSGDNGAMIAWAGVLAHSSGQKIDIENSSIRQKWRTDEVDIPWL